MFFASNHELFTLGAVLILISHPILQFIGSYVYLIHLSAVRTNRFVAAAKRLAAQSDI